MKIVHTRTYSAFWINPVFPKTAYSQIGEPHAYDSESVFPANKTCIVVPKGKRLTFDAFRKLFISTGKNLNLDPDVVKALCGKSVEASILTYMTTVQWREAFTKISDVLKITQMANRNHARLEELEVQTKKQAEQIALLLQTLALAAPKEKAEAVKKIILQAKKSEKA